MRYLIPLIVVVAGCANVRPPVDVTLIPNDCANQQRIVRWLESQSQGEWNEHRAQIRARIWHLRYTCNLV